MKIKSALTTSPLSIGELGLSGVRTLGIGKLGLRQGEVEELELVGEMVKISCKGKSAYVHISRFEHVVIDG